MSQYPNYNAPAGWQPPAYAPPPQGPYRPQKTGGGGNGCMLAAIIVGIVVGIPTILICAGVGYFAFYVKSEVDKQQAKMEEHRARAQEQAAQAFPGGVPAPPPFTFPQEKAITNAQEAIDALNTNDWQQQKKGAEWLATNPVDAGKKDAAAKALEKEIASFHRDVAENCLTALGTYGSKDQTAAVVKALKEHRVDRRKAIEQLGKWKDPAAAEALVELLDDGGPEGEAAVAALEQIGVAASLAVGARLDPSRPLANGRAEKLLTTYGVDLQDTLITTRLAIINSNDVFRKRDAIKALGGMAVKPERQAEVARALDKLVMENDRGAREEALNALVVWGDKESVPSLVNFVKSETFVNKTAVQLLGKFQDPRAVEALVALLDNSFADETELNKALVSYGAEAEKEVLKSLHDSRRKARERARAILTALDTKPEVLLTQTLADLTSSEDQKARSALEWLASATIDEAHRKEVGAKLLEAAKSPNPFMQGSAVEALVKLNDPGTYEAIGELVKNPISQGRVSMALNKAGPAGEDLLISLLRSPEPNVIVFACFALQRSGSDRSVQPLQAVLKKPSTAMNQQAQFAAKVALDAIQKRVKK